MNKQKTKSTSKQARNAFAHLNHSVQPRTEIRMQTKLPEYRASIKYTPSLHANHGPSAPLMSMHLICWIDGTSGVFQIPYGNITPRLLTYNASVLISRNWANATKIITCSGLKILYARHRRSSQLARNEPRTKP